MILERAVLQTVFTAMQTAASRIYLLLRPRTNLSVGLGL